MEMKLTNQVVPSPVLPFGSLLLGAHGVGVEGSPAKWQEKQLATAIPVGDEDSAVREEGEAKAVRSEGVNVEGNKVSRAEHIRARNS